MDKLLMVKPANNDLVNLPPRAGAGNRSVFGFSREDGMPSQPDESSNELS